MPHPIKNDACDPDQIDRFLTGRLSPREEQAFESHLDDCADCRSQLESAAARDDVWSGVRGSLSIALLK